MPPFLPVFNLFSEWQEEGAGSKSKPWEGWEEAAMGGQPNQLLGDFPNYPPHPHHEFRGAKDRSLMSYRESQARPRPQESVGTFSGLCDS